MNPSAKDHESEQKRISRREFVKDAGVGAAALAGAAGALSAMPAQAQIVPQTIPARWDIEADVVVIGSGATGLPAAIRARDQGATVLVVEANYDIGGHGLLNGGQVPLGGGTSNQKKHGVKDDPETLFKDLTDWTIVETNGMPEYRYNDRVVQRALADNEAPAFEFLLENGVVFEGPPGVSGGHAIGLSAPRENYAKWDKGQSAESPRGGGGTAIYRPLEVSARKKGVKFLLNYHMDVIHREKPNEGRVLGVQASYHPRFHPETRAQMRPFREDATNVEMTAPTVNIKAKKGIIIATGGSSSNVNFRRIFDPRLTDEYDVAGEPYSAQDASGELAAMAIGATLWGTASGSMERNGALRKRDLIGARYLYASWTPKSPMFPFAGASGLAIKDWQDAILVNQVGKRVYNELAEGWPYGTHHGFLDPYVHGDWRNPMKIKYAPDNYQDALLSMNEGSGPPDYAAGPTWAIFDADAVVREKWTLGAPYTDPLYFYSANTLPELAARLQKNPRQRVAMPGTNLEATVARYNLMVDLGHDPDFEKPTPKYKIAKPPFYAAWACLVVHDTYAGLRINMKCQVMDLKGEVIPGLYCGGESAGGCSQHGQGRCITQGYIAGKAAAEEKSWS